MYLFSIVFFLFTGILYSEDFRQWDYKIADRNCIQQLIHNNWNLMNCYFNENDTSEWNSIQLPKNLSSLETDKDSNNIYWIRKKFTVENFDPNSPLSIRMGIILDRDRVWLNGNWIAGTGEWNSDQPQAYDKIRIYNLPEQFLNRNEENEITVLVKRYFPEEIGIGQDEVTIGYTHDLDRDFYSEEGFRLGFLVLYGTVAFYFLFLYLRRMKDKEYLFFALFTINLVVYQFFRTQSKFFLELEFHFLKQIEYLVLPSFIPLMAHFIRYFINHKYSNFMKLLDFMSISIFLIFLSVGSIIEMDYWNRNTLQPLWILYVLNSLSFLISETRKKNLDAALILLGILMIVVSAVYDILGARFLWNQPRISGYIFLFNVIFQGLLLANRFVRLNKQVEELNSNLEIKVQERTEELENTLNRVNELKVQQDGDYFLISLLLSPLHRNKNKSSTIHSEICTIQKKKFDFKNRQYQIGGDLTLTEEIELNGESYLLFINSDAMGKSIQGAGGSLVLGVVIESILARSASLTNRNKYPEKWIKDSFNDIQKAFETFDGSMFVSIILGLVHIDSGFVYYFNAEHPKIILLRDSKAEFLETDDDRHIWKMGIYDNENRFSVSTFQMKENDILIFGTDGRDDILILSESGEKNMNENENLFQSVVSKMNGKLHDIVNELKSLGELSDDLSLLKISYYPINQNKYTNDNRFLSHFRRARKSLTSRNIKQAKYYFEKAHYLDPQNLTVLKILSKLYYSEKNYELALEYSTRVNKIDPSAIDYLFIQAKSLKKLGLIKSAIDTAERLRLREPQNPNYKDFLISLYNTSYIRPNPISKSSNLKAA
ncbi:SpoIIE family protein phosphatase [Leptospira sp. GIMC2001]|uniref:SpoIIE family protein phosphatase n=1 Tax=Leptospira sp. GIMC2001 TaxID=1513297 RepID=UPI0023494D7C|nr:SpoIIE family protein phosphatase [Leptospira sp. GIMC2001]WCL48057.1 SpoIIE family protein phosphatase [Leptospira sp. GIMC2001]